MAGFTCKKCGFDLTLRMDLLALAVQADHPDGDYPNDLSVDGACEKCGQHFNYCGELFTYWLITKAEENVISPETDKYAIVEFSLSDEEVEQFQRLLDSNNKQELDHFIRRMVLRTEEE